MRIKVNSGAFINYKEYTNSSSASGIANTSARPDSLASTFENKTAIYEHSIYPAVIKMNDTPEITEK